MSDDKIRPSWKDIHDGCKNIHNQYLNHYSMLPDCVVGLTRGGLIPSTILSHLFDIPLIPVCYTSAVGKGGKTMYNSKELQPIDLKPSNHTELVVFLVDEICDSGNTLNEVSRYYISLDYLVVTGVIHHRLDSVHYPTFCSSVLRKADPWVVYPWEVE